MSSQKLQDALSARATRRMLAQFRAFVFSWTLPRISPGPWLRSRSDPLEIPAAYGNLNLELQYRIPMSGRVSLLTDLNLVGISAAMGLAVLALRVIGIWLANDFAFSIFMLLALVLACHAFLPRAWTEPRNTWWKILLFALAILLVKAMAGNASLAALFALIAIVVTCALGDDMVTNWVCWYLADPRLHRPAVAAWSETWHRRLEAPKELPDYWIAFAGIAAASLLAMVLSVAIVPPPYLGMGFVTLFLFFVFVLLAVSIIWQPQGAMHAIRSSWEPLVNWFHYNPNETAAPGVYQSPFHHRRPRVWIVLALLVVSLLPLAAFFPIHKALFPGTPWLSAAAQWSPNVQAAPESWLLIAARGALSGDSRYVWAVVMGVLASVIAPVALLISTAMLIASRAVPTIKNSPQLQSRRKGSEFNFYVEQIQNSRYVHPDKTQERDHFFLGIDTIHGRPILLARELLDGHAHILGSTQSGKTSLALTPMISQMIRSLRPSSKEYPSQSSILILDLKGDMPMFQNTKIECERRGVKFKHFTLGYREASYAFNPFEQTHLADVSPDQRADMLAQAMGIFYGHKYPEVFWSDINAQVFRTLLLCYPEIRSFARFHTYMKEPSWYRTTGGTAEEWKKASHVKAAADKLARIVPLNVTAKETPSADVYRDRIDMRNLGSLNHDPEVVYFFIRATDDESAGHAVAKLALYSLLAAVNTIPEKEKKRTYVVIDEFQCIALDTLSRLFEQAAGLKVSYILGNQSLATLPDIIQEVLAENTAFRQIFRAGSVKSRKNIRERSGDSIYHLYSQSISENVSLTIGQHIGPGYFDSEIIRTSYEDSVSWVEMSAGRGFSRYGGHIFTIHTPHHISKIEYERRKRLGFPPVGRSTLIAADAQRILEVYQPRMMTREGLAETLQQQLAPAKPPQEPALAPVRSLPAFEACVAAFEQSLTLTQERVRSGVLPETNTEGEAV